MNIIKYLFELVKQLALKLQQSFQECSTNLFIDKNVTLWADQEEKSQLIPTSNNEQTEEFTDTAKNEESSIGNYRSYFATQLRKRFPNTKDTNYSNSYREDEPLLKPAQVHKKFSLIRKPFFKRFETANKDTTQHLGCGDVNDDFERHPLLSKSGLGSESDISIWSDDQDQQEVKTAFTCFGCLSLAFGSVKNVFSLSSHKTEEIPAYKSHDDLCKARGERVSIVKPREYWYSVMNEAGDKRIRRDSVKNSDKICEEKIRRKRRKTDFQTIHKFFSPMKEISKPRIVELMQKSLPQGASGDAEKPKELSNSQKNIIPEFHELQKNLELPTEPETSNASIETDKYDDVLSTLMTGQLQTSEESL